MNPQIYQALAISSALKVYARTGIKVNRAYTPKAMMRTAEKILERKFAPRDYLGAAAALSQWAQEQ